MRRQLTGLATLISASLAYHQAEATPAVSGETDRNVDHRDGLDAAVLNTNISTQLAAHRSHSSHRSHRSHRSSSGGGYRPSAPSTPSYTPAPSPRTADPLGQQARPEGSFPKNTKDMTLEDKLKDKELRKNIIMRMQLTLQMEGYYDGAIDGIMGPKTRAAAKNYKKANDIPGDTVLDAQTLNSLGIVGY